jgi:catechol 2,3-dioxygenase-like lactoylglutathione lyase family enzyme
VLDHLAVQVADVGTAATSSTQVLTRRGVRELVRRSSDGAVVGRCGPDGHPGYYGVFLRVPDGNAVHHTWAR